MNVQVVKDLVQGLQRALCFWTLFKVIQNPGMHWPWVVMVYASTTGWYEKREVK